MKLSQCKIGTIVKMKDLSIYQSTYDTKKVGYIVGLAWNYMTPIMMSNPSSIDSAEVIPLVLWVGENVPTPVYHNNLTDKVD